MNQFEDENSVKERVIAVLKDCKISVNKLSSAIGIRQTTLNDQINGNSKIATATLIGLANFRQDISAEWLLRGIGSMYKNNESENDTIAPASNQADKPAAKITLELEVNEDRIIKLRLKDKVIQLAD